MNFDYMIDYDIIENIYKKICSRTKHKKKIILFETSKFAYFIRIYSLLKERTYTHGKYNIFLIKYPKYRIIMSENLHDKIVNHLVSKYCLYPVINKHLLDINIATRPGMGLDKGINYIKKTFNLIRNEYNEYYCLKCDISKYFYSIDHEILFQKLEKILFDVDVINLIKNIVNSTNLDYVNKRIISLVNNEIKKINKLDCSSRSKEKVVEKLKAIPLYSSGKGLPIGNMTSQILAIFYLNDLDHYIKEKLHIKYYLRYMDDLILFHKDKDYLKYCKNKIAEKLKKEKLLLNNKTSIIKISNGLVFLGYRFINKNGKIILLMNKNMRKKIKKRYKKDGNIILNKYNGYFLRCKSHKYRNGLLQHNSV